MGTRRGALVQLNFLIGGGVHLPSADVSGAGCRKRRRAPFEHRGLGVPRIPDADEPVCGANCGGRIAPVAGRGQPRFVRSHRPAVPRPKRACDAVVLGRFFVRDINGHRGDYRACDDGVQPHCGPDLADDPQRWRGHRFGRCALCHFAVAAPVYRGHFAAWLPVLPCVGWRDRFGGHWVDFIHRCGAGIACPDRWCFLAWGHAGWGGDGPDHWLCCLELDVVFA